MSDSTGTWSTRRLLVWTTQYLEAKALEHPRLSAEMLLGHVLEVPRLALYTDPDRPASELERAAFRTLVERAAAGEPVDYLVGKAPFFSMMLPVSPAVLIPRPSTEAVVEHVIQHSRRTPGFSEPLIFDIGTGSGAIAIALAKHIPGCSVIATDISDEALALAQENAADQGAADSIEFREGNLLEPVADQRARYLVSNPPYISDSEWQDVPSTVKDYEPTYALRGGVDGLKYLRPIIHQARQHLESPGQLVLEGPTAQMRTLVELADQAALTNGHVLPDHESLPRVLVADNP